MTSTLGCITGSPATSNTVTVSVNPVLPVSVTIVADQNNICQGTPVTFTATAVNGGVPSYQWFLNGNAAGFNQPVFTCTPGNGDQVYVVVTSSLNCISGNPATSNIVVMTVNTPLPASVSIISDLNNVCAGTQVTFTATAMNGGFPVYQWYVNGNQAGLNQATLIYAPVDGDLVNVSMTSSLSCISGSPATSNTLAMVVNQAVAAGVSVSADNLEVCEGTAVTVTAVPANGGLPDYQWFKNGLPAGLNSNEFTFIPAHGDMVYAVMTSSLTCVSGSPAVSNVLEFSVEFRLPVSVTVIPDQNPVCTGTPVTCSATALNGGAASYQWYRNLAAVGLDEPVFTFIPENGDQIYAVVRSSLECVSGNPATSNVVTVTVNDPVEVSVTISADHTEVCSGSIVTFTPIAVNGGAPVYQWRVNGTSTGTGDPTFSYIPMQGDLVDLIMTSSLSCVTGNPAASNPILLAVTALPGNAGAVVGPDTGCTGTDGLVYSTTPIGNASSYVWNLPAGVTLALGSGTSQITINTGSDSTAGLITVKGINQCGEGGMSPGFQLTVNPVPAPPVVTLDWPVLQSSSNSGNQWYFEGVPLQDSTGQHCLADKPGWYWAVVTKGGCVSDTSNHVYVDETDPNTFAPGIKVYPIPNDGHFTVSIALLSPEVYSITINTNLGKKIFELKDIRVVGQFKKIIDLRPLAGGVYTVVFRNGSQQIVKKVIVGKTK
jgi:hypothetical protein